MEKQVVFKCRSCEHINRQELGMPGFEFRQVTFESFTDAWTHLVIDGSHEMIAVIEDDEDEE